MQSQNPPEAGWTLVISPRVRWYDLRLGEVWQARDLIWLLVRRDFVAVHKQTILGPLWHLLQPLLTTLTFTVLFGRIAGLPTDGVPPFLFYMSGIVVWGYFAACLTGTANTFIGNAGLFGKVYFPRLAVPISVVISRLVELAMQFAMFLGFLAYEAARGAPVRLTWAVLLTPLLVAMMAGYGLGLGILVSALTTRYRDLQLTVGFGVQLLMYATPVIYPLGAMTGRYRDLIAANPISPIVEAFRRAYLGTGDLSAGGLAYSLAGMLITLAAGLFLFHRVEATVMDTV